MKRTQGQWRSEFEVVDRLSIVKVSKMTSTIYQQFKDLFGIITHHVINNHDAVVERLKEVASGSDDLVETLSVEERRYLPILFGWVVEMGPENVINILYNWVKESGVVQAYSSDEELDPSFKFNPWPIDINNLPPLPIPKLPEGVTVRGLERLAVLLVSYLLYDQFHYPQPETGRYDISGNPLQKLRWIYRYWFNQLEVAEKGSGLEDFFSSQNLEEILPLEDRLDMHYQVACSISCAGDLLAVDVLTPENTKHLFDDIVDFYSSADIVSANLESTVDSSKPIGRTQSIGNPAKMNTSTEMFDKFRHEAKINFFSTATNHAMDWGPEGVLATIDVIKNSGAKFSGTASSLEEQDNIVVVEHGGIKVALLAYTFDLNGYSIPDDKPYLVNEVRFNDVNPAPDYSLLRRQVRLAREKGADWIVAYCHWGWEFEMYPHLNITEAARHVIECGVDTIFGNHAHVPQPAQVVPRVGKQDALVFYSYGDFVSYHPESRNSKISYITKIGLATTTQGVKVISIKNIPIYISNQPIDKLAGKFDCRVLNFFDVLYSPEKYGLSDLEKQQLPHLKKKVWDDILSPLSRTYKVLG